MNSVGRYLFDFWKVRKMIIEMARKDIKSRYLGSALGAFWAFLHPSILILVYWFVFQMGFRSVPINNFPYILWLMAGLVPWFFISESVSSATSSIIENSYLVKKVVFRVSLLPIIKIISSLFIHIFFVIILFLMFFFYGYHPVIYNLQVLYYLVATICFVTGLAFITSALTIFLKDIGQFVGVFLQLFFWITPIFWTLAITPKKYQIWFKLNPCYYLVEGYRDTFIYHRWFWEHNALTPYFWCFNIILLLLGFRIFKQLRQHFADVL